MYVYSFNYVKTFELSPFQYVLNIIIFYVNKKIFKTGTDFIPIS